jgi:hypothetical protein
MRIADFSVLAILAVVGCGEKPPPETPFILTDVQSLGFDTQFASGTVVGMSPTNSVTITNAGLSDLSITDVVKSGDSQFFMRLEDQACRATPPQTPDCDPTSSVLPKTVKGKQNTFIQVFFTPTDVKVYRGVINIKSNAENVKDLEIRLCGIGIRSGADGGSPEIPDGGCER